MKIGDLVIEKIPAHFGGLGIGLITGFVDGDPIVFWNEEFPAEHEYAEQLEVVQNA